MSKTAFSERKKRGAFPEREVLELCKKKPELDSHYILTGIDAAQHARLAANQRHITKLVDADVPFDNIREEARESDARQQQEVKAVSTRYYSDSEGLNRNLALIEEFIFVPRHDVRASAGKGIIIHDETIVDHLAFKRDWLTQTLGCSEHAVCVIQVRGDSM